MLPEVEQCHYSGSSRGEGRRTRQTDAEEEDAGEPDGGEEMMQRCERRGDANNLVVHPPRTENGQWPADRGWTKELVSTARMPFIYPDGLPPARMGKLAGFHPGHSEAEEL